MNGTRFIPFLLAALLLALRAGPLAAEPVRIDGSSTVYPITAAIAEEHRKIDAAGADVKVAFSGTTAGFRKLCAAEIDIADASRPILADEMASCRDKGVAYIELPVGFDALTLVANASNGFADCLSVADLRRVWAPEAEGKLMRWSQVHSRWPDLPLRLYGAGADSGTFDYFTEAIVGRARAQRADYTASEDDKELVRGIAADPGSLGYLPAAYVAEHAGKFKVVAISERTPECVAPTELNVRNGRYRPLSRPLFVYVNARAAERPEVAAFVDHYLSRAGIVATRVGYVALPQEAYATAAARFQQRRTGTVFGGEPQVGLRVRDLLERELPQLSHDDVTSGGAPLAAITIYHNPACGTSRNVLALIRNSGAEPEIIKYLKNPPSRPELVDLVRRMGIPVRELLRRQGTPYDELGLDDPTRTDEKLIDLMLEHPILINRPIVVTPLGVRLCRPSEAVLDLLPDPQRGAFAKEDGERVVDERGRRVGDAG